MNPPLGPEIPYWDVFCDDNGISHQRRDSLIPNAMNTVSPGSATAPQWIVTLSGRWYVETMDGHRVEMGPGEISFGVDQGCRWVEGKRGHLSGALGEEPVVLILIQVEDQPTR
ncbi:MAG: cupin domain-containing protein [Gammaproteobacteria bacterium]|nr:cupin domain-containing protein [Gammaproteobacteria bacterium]